MKQFFTIFLFEVKGYLKNKVFIGMTLAFIITIGILLSFPRISSLFGSSDSTLQPSTDPSAEKSPIVLLQSSDYTDEIAILNSLKEAMPNKDIQLTDKSAAELETIVGTDNIESAIVLKSKTEYSYIVKNLGMYDNSRRIIDEVMLHSYKVEQMTSLGLSSTEIDLIINSQIKSELIQTGTDQNKNFIYTYALIFVLYFAIILYGQMVATGVASEKSSRAMEMLITSASAKNLMFGKILGSCFAGMLQIIAVLGSTIVFYNLNASIWKDNLIIQYLFDIPASLLVYTIIFFILGFLVYGFMFGAVGSLASKVEDINTTSTPITIIYIIAFFIVIFSTNSGNVNSNLMIIASYVPLTSPMAMFARIAMGEVHFFEISISILILIAFVFLIGYLASKIYQIGVLLYGTPPKPSVIIKALMNKK